MHTELSFISKIMYVGSRHIHSHVYTRTYTHIACEHTPTYIHTHTHVHTYVHICTKSCPKCTEGQVNDKVDKALNNEVWNWNQSLILFCFKHIQVCGMNMQYSFFSLEFLEKWSNEVGCFDSNIVQKLLVKLPLTYWLINRWYSNDLLIPWIHMARMSDVNK